MEYTFWQSLDTSKVKVFGISVGESDSVAQAFAQNFGLTFPVLRDPAAAIYYEYRVTGISPFPLDCIIDQQGIIRYLHSEYDPQYMLEIINGLLATTDTGRLSFNNSIPRKLDLEIYPNPTNSSTMIEFQIIHPGEIRLEVFDVIGRRTFSGFIENSGTGNKIRHFLELDSQASGLYYVAISNGPHREVRKVLLIR